MSRYRTVFTGAHWAVVSRSDGRQVDAFNPGDRGKREAEETRDRLNAPGVRTLADVVAVVENAGFRCEERPAPFHGKWVAGDAVVIVRDDPLGTVSTLVKCPQWTRYVQLPAGVPESVVAFVVEAARDAVSFQVRAS